VRDVNEGKSTLYVWHSLAKPRIIPLAAQNARFVRASKFRSDEGATLYVVAVSEPDHAIEIVRGKAVTGRLTDFRGSARKELSRFSLDKIFSDFV